MKIKLLIIGLLFLCGTLGACSSVNIRTDPAAETSRSPDYQKRYTYWFWGLKGKHSVNVREVCRGKKVEQIQAVDTFTDNLLYLVTLGIYSPRTARVWCKGQVL